ncbi:unnamed protein product [Mortierella alpina]
MGAAQSNEVVKGHSDTFGVSSFSSESEAEAQSSLLDDSHPPDSKHLPRERTNSDTGSDWSAISALSASEGYVSPSCWSPPQSCASAKSLDHLGIPANVWRAICSYLYPSQLARLSLVSKALYEVVAGQEIWTDWFERSYANGALQQTLRIIPGMSPSKCHMLYMCATSFQVCEGCFRRCTVTYQRGKMIMMPLAVVVRTKPVLTSSGSVHNQEWTIRFCKACRLEHFMSHPEPVPDSIHDSFLTKRQIKEKFHLSDNEVKAITNRGVGPRSGGMVVTYSEVDALLRARLEFGGDVGLRAHLLRTTKQMTAMRHRVFLYHTRWRVAMAGQEWLKGDEYHARKNKNAEL